MYTLHRLIIWIMILISPARIIAALPLAIPAQAQASVATPAPYQVNLDTSQKQAFTIEVPATPNFDTDVMEPIQAIRAKEAVDAAAKAEAEAQAKAEALKLAAAKAVAPVIVAGEDAYAQLRYCEAGGDYTRNSGNGYYGAYQYSISTWNNYAGFARADLAPAAVQDERIHADVARKGWGAWPACSRKLGLM